jgi:hypothetical protein
MLYLNNAESPTEVEFQYYRSVKNHTDAQQGDQIYVYKLNSSGTWSVMTRNSFTKIVAGGDLSSSYSDGVLTLSATIPTVPTKTSDLTNDSGFITTDSDEKVKLTSTATGGSYPVIFGPTSITSGSTYSMNYNSNIVAVPSEGRLDIKRILIRWTDWNDAYVKLDMCSTSGNAPDYYIPTLKFESGAVNTSGGTDKLVQIRGVKTPTDLSTSSMMDYVATVKYVNDSIPKVYSSTNTGGYLTMATLPIYDGTVV